MRNPNAKHAGAVGSKHRCDECNHPGGASRRLGAHKKPCSCTCHQDRVTACEVLSSGLENGE